MVLSVYVDTHEPSGHGGELTMRVVPFRFDVPDDVPHELQLTVRNGETVRVMETCFVVAREVPGTNWKPFGPVLLAEGESVAVELLERVAT